MKPTYEDIVKYHSQRTQLLVNIECYALPLELKIDRIIEDGAMFAFTNGFQHQWVKTEQVEVLHVFPPRELTKRIWELEEAEKRKARKQDHKNIDKVIEKADEVLTSESLYKIFNSLSGAAPFEPLTKPKKKKCKKKKNCPSASSK